MLFGGDDDDVIIRIENVSVANGLIVLGPLSLRGRRSALFVTNVTATASLKEVVSPSWRWLPLELRNALPAEFLLAGPFVVINVTLAGGATASVRHLSLARYGQAASAQYPGQVFCALCCFRLVVREDAQVWMDNLTLVNVAYTKTDRMYTLYLYDLQMSDQAVLLIRSAAIVADYMGIVVSAAAISRNSLLVMREVSVRALDCAVALADTRVATSAHRIGNRQKTFVHTCSHLDATLASNSQS